jgi:hypothetical protein
MPRTRSVWPEFFTKAELMILPAAQRLFYAGLPTQCDHAGRGDDKPLELRIRLLPFDQVDAEEIMLGLERAGLLVRYQVDGKRYFAINRDDWKRQHPHVDEKKKPPRPPPPGVASDTRSTPLVPDGKLMLDSGTSGARPVVTPGDSGASTGQAPGLHGYLLSLVSDPLSLITKSIQPSAAAGAQQALGLPADEKEKVTDEQRDCRRAISEAFASAFATRAKGQKYSWTAADRAAVATWANKFGNDPTRALDLLAEFQRRMATDDLYAKNFCPAFIGSPRQLNALALPPVDRPQRRQGFVPLTKTKERFAKVVDDDEFGLNLRPTEEENHG